MKHINIKWLPRVKHAAVAGLFLAAYTIGSVAPFWPMPKAHAMSYDTGWKTPTAAQASSGWANSAAASVQANDNVVTTNNTGATQGYGSFNFGIPAGATINGIAVATNAFSSDSNGCRLGLRLSWDGGTSTSDVQYAKLTDVKTAFELGSATDTWGSHVWTQAELNSASFLSLIQDYDSDNSCENAATTSVDTLSVKVFYDLPVQPVANPALSQACGLDIAIVIDNSTSISSTEMAQMKSALTSFTNALAGTPTEFSVTRFASSAAVLQPFTSDVTAVNAAINGVPTGGGYTNWEDGLVKAQSTLPNRVNPDLVIFATDGDPTTSNTVGGTDTNQPNAHLEPAVIAANSLKNGGARILALGIGLGNDAGSVSRLQQISGPNLNTGSVLTSDVITTNFSTLAQSLAAFATETCGGTITTQKLLDADGNPATTGDQTPAAGWSFDINSGSNPAPTTTDSKGLTPAVKVDAGTGYSVNETVQSGYSVIGASCTGAAANGTWNGAAVTGMQIAANNVVRCTFVNAVKKGHITVHKVTNPAGDTTAFSVTASGSGVITGAATRTVSTTSDAVYEVTYGTYGVTETAVDGWSQTGNTCTGVVVNDANPNPSCTITNTKLAKLRIVKDALPNGTQSFAYTTTGTGLSDFSLVDDGTVAASQKQFTGLLPGAYTVTETALPGWALTGLTCTGTSATVTGSQASVRLTAGQDVTCTYTNTKLGSLSGTKYEVNADSSVVNGSAGWVIALLNNGVSTGLTQTTGANGSYTFGNLLPGNYSVSETLQSGWTQVYAPSSTPAPLAAGQQITAQNFGNFKNGSISGYKFNDHNGNHVEDTGDEHLSGWEMKLYKVSATGSTQVGSPVVTNAQGNYTFSNLAPGTYSVCETAQAGWVQTYPTQNVCHEVVITLSGQTTTGVKFGNQGQGSLTVKKDVDSDGDGTVDSANVSNWQWDAGATSYATGTTQTVAAGTYTVSEHQQENYHFVSVSCTDNGTPLKVTQNTAVRLTVTPGHAVVCTFTNSRDTGFIKVVKQLQPSEDAGRFNLSINDSIKKADASDGDDTGFVRVITGSHTVAETAGTDTSLADYDSEYYCSDDNSEDEGWWAYAEGTSISIPVTTGQHITCTFYNTRRAQLTIVKDAQPQDGQDFTFTVTRLPDEDTVQQRVTRDSAATLLELAKDATVTRDAGDTFELDDDADATLPSSKQLGLSPGLYSVEESPTAGWDLTSIDCGDDVEWYQEGTTAYVYLTAGQKLTCTFTNTKRATVTITKDAQPDTAQPFGFTTDLESSDDDGVTSFSLTDTGVSSLASTTFSDVVPGTYTVTEAAVSGWTLASISCTGAETTRDGTKLTMVVAPGAAVHCTFVNKKNTIPQVLGATTPPVQPKLEDTGTSLLAIFAASTTVMALAIVTILSNRRRENAKL